MQPHQDRRSFLKNTITGGTAVALGFGGIIHLLQSCAGAAKISSSSFHTGFDQTPLTYAYDALENCIDAQTMEIHYTRHAAAYSKNLKEAAQAEKVDTKQPLETLLADISKYSSKMRNNAGGHYNHEMFWKCMKPKTEENKPSGNLMKAIQKKYGSFDAFKKEFSEAGKNRFGSGWAWLCKNEKKELSIGSTANQDNPLMNISSVEIKGFPILCLDVWEHAYYLKYQNKRVDYIENWWKLVNWEYVQKRFESA